MTMEERITEIVDYCRNNNCEVSKSCGQCRTNATKQIAALIAADRAGLVEALTKALQLCGKVIELAENGDYANGNTAGTLDEGSVLAFKYLKELKDEYSALKEMGK